MFNRFWLMFLIIMLFINVFYIYPDKPGFMPFSSICIFTYLIITHVIRWIEEIVKGTK